MLPRVAGGATGHGVAMDTDAVVVQQDEVAQERWSDPVRGELSFQPLVGTTGRTAELTAGIAELGPGGWLGRHRHEPAEVYHVLGGTGTLEAGGATHALRPGTTVWLPGGLPHAVRCEGQEPLRVFYAFAVDSDDDVRYEFLERG